MQTFLPYAPFDKSADTLDPKRRWKQVVEVAQMLKALEQGPYTAYDTKKKVYKYGSVKKWLAKGRRYTKRATPWYNHSATRMWRGYEPALRLYFNHMLVAVIRSKSHRVTAYMPFDLRTVAERNPPLPPWLGKKKFHASHRSNLLRKDPDFYGQYGWTEKPNLPYHWPVPLTTKRGK